MHGFTLAWWKERIGHVKLANVTPAMLVEYRGKLSRETYTRGKPESKRSTIKGREAQQYKRSPATVNRYLAALSHVFTVARKEWHWISYNPFDGVGKLGEGKGVVRCLSQQERDALLAETAKDPVLHTFVMLALSTAPRAGELLKLTWSDIDFKNGHVLLRVTKNAQPRAVWLHGEALRLLQECAKVRHINDDRVFRSPKGKKYGYKDAFKAAVLRAGIPKFRFHDLRHTAATYLAMAGATEQQLRAIGGWKSGVVSRYVHLAAQDAKEVLAKMNQQVFGRQLAKPAVNSDE